MVQTAFRHGGQPQIRSVSYHRQSITGGPPCCGLGIGLTIHCKRMYYDNFIWAAELHNVKKI
jgi:hypothetical protein